MLTLMLLRHAKSSWSSPEIADLDRPLSPRGRRAAQAMGRLIASGEPQPELVLCSPAKRARNTWKLVADEIKSAPKLIIDERIYDFGNGGGLIDVAVKCAGSAKTLMLVGHNPSIERLAARLAKTGDKKLRARMERKYPTAALAVIAIDAADWTALGDADGELLNFTRPKDIMANAGD